NPGAPDASDTRQPPASPAADAPRTSAPPGAPSNPGAPDAGHTHQPPASTAADAPRPGAPTDPAPPGAPTDPGATAPVAASASGRRGLAGGETGTRAAAPVVAAGRAPHPAGRSRHAGRRRVVVAAGAALLVAVVSAGVAIAGDGDGRPRASVAGSDDGGAPGDRGAAPSTTTTTRPAPRQAFTLAVSRLGEAGSFTYSGTVSATDVSTVRPTPWLSVDLTVEGEVSLTGSRLHEVAVANGGKAVETVAVGATVWGRAADRRDRLDDRAYQRIPALSDPEAPAKGAALLPTWLAAATGHTDAGRDALGRRRIAATVPAEVFGTVERETEPVSASLIVTVDATGTPVRVEVTSQPDGPRLVLAYDLAGLGTPVAITPPA
ncbi:MAG TPA: hypothetical protein VFI47_23670, partial [Acidimicrobiales bacterium]|nr:hypothetical protein [Acidimicrobiales bacterium]